MDGDIIFQSRDGLNLFAKSCGPVDADLTVLCLHGLTRNHKDFDPLLSKLSAHRRYISMDVRGRGKSDRDHNPSRYRPDVYAQDVIELLDQVQPKNLVLIGTSMGGIISLILSQILSSQLLGVILNDVGPKVEPIGLKRISEYVGDFVEHDSLEAAATAIQVSQHDVYPNFAFNDWLAFAKRTHVENANGKFVLDYDPEIVSVLKDVSPNLSVEMQMWAVYAATYKRPLLVIRGELSDLFSVDTAVKMVHRHGRAKIVSVPNVGHAPILDEPVCVKAIESFLKRIEDKL